jgi:biopolymer transport protein TolQ
MGACPARVACAQEVCLIAVLQPVRSIPLGAANNSILSYFRDTGPLAKGVLAILLVFSFLSWVIIIGKFIRIKQVGRQSRKFLDFFRKSRRFSEVNTVATTLTESPLTTLFRAGYAELDAQIKAARSDESAPQTTGKLVIKNIAGIERALERGITIEMARLTKYMTFLATTAAATPFIGLFGTVWGIMTAFRAIGTTGSTSIVAVAPGIAEALINTAGGLAAAIPALIAYNYFMGRLRLLRGAMEDFSLEFVNLAERNFT